jgi:outer membrane lipoprotein-sorting protein
LLESESVRKGVFYYARFGQRSKLRVNFQTLKHDDEKEQKYVEHFIFDGVWLMHIDYQTKQPKMYQLVEPNKPADAFEMASKNLPIIGFTKVEDLKKHFEIKLVERTKDEDKSLIHLHLKTRSASIYKDQYTSIDFWIDRKLGLPAKVIAVTTEPEPPFSDIYQIKLLKAKVDQKIDEKLFEFTIPDGFSEPEVVPLKKKTE